MSGAMFAAMAVSDSAMASQQLMTLADADNRGLALLVPLVPAIGWVLFNILQPALNQVNKMRGAKALVAGAGLGALATLAAPHADAAQEIAQLADSDSRGLVLLGILAPAVGWVLFNILQPALNQLNKMRAQKGMIGAIGLGAASMLLTPQADAAQVRDINLVCRINSRQRLVDQVTPVVKRNNHGFQNYFCNVSYRVAVCHW